MCEGFSRVCNEGVWMCVKGSASVFQRRTDTDEPVCVGKLGPSDYFGMPLVIFVVL